LCCSATDEALFASGFRKAVHRKVAPQRVAEPVSMCVRPASAELQSYKLLYAAGRAVGAVLVSIGRGLPLMHVCPRLPTRHVVCVRCTHRLGLPTPPFTEGRDTAHPQTLWPPKQARMGRKDGSVPVTGWFVSKGLRGFLTA
jgi:hypothetical protein